MHEESLIAQRIVHDHMKSMKLEAFEVLKSLKAVLIMLTVLGGDILMC